MKPPVAPRQLAPGREPPSAEDEVYLDAEGWTETVTMPPPPLEIEEAHELVLASELARLRRSDALLMRIVAHLRAAGVVR